MPSQKTDHTHVDITSADSLNLQSKFNRAKYSIEIIHHIVIPKADYLISLRFQISSALNIVFCLLKMLAAIEFNHQFLFDRDKVNDVVADGVTCPR